MRSLIACTHRQISDKVKEDAMDSACSMNRREDYAKFWKENQKESDH
jgi:hypothetical protein